MAMETAIELTVLGNTVRVSHPAIPPNLVTYLSASVAAGVTSLTVLDNYPFALNDYLVIGRLGLDSTEIIQITGAVTQGTALTTGATVYAHSVDVPVMKILWNQVEISTATTVAGAKTVITTINLQPDRSETTFFDTTIRTGFYFVRFKNSTTTLFSSYSAAAPVGGYATTSVRSVKDSALAMTNEKVDGVLFTDQFLNNEIFNCEQEVWSEKQKWSWAYTFDKILGQLVEGGYSFALPTDISDPNSEKSILERGVRIGDRADLSYITKEEWDRFFILTRHTTVATSIGIGDVTIVLTSVADLDTSGSIVIGADNAINYTGVTVATNTLTGVTGVTATHAVGVDVWQNPAFSEPSYFTIFSGNLYFQAGVISTFAGKNVYLSYYRKPTAITSDNDTLNLPDFTIYNYFLAWKILLRKNNGASTPESDNFHKLYTERKDILKHIDRTGQRVFMKPRIAPINSPTDQLYVRTSFLRVDNS